MNKHHSRFKHGLYGSPEYKSWSSMKSRCFDPNNKSYHRYGGRGISVCISWVNSFQKFYDDMGPRPTRIHTLERIKNDLGYSPSNCRWATRLEQSNNTDQNRNLVFNGTSKSLSQWAMECGMLAATLRARLNKLGWSLEKSLSVSPKYHH